MLSSVAGIVDAAGGMRIVVTERWRMKHHVGAGERLFVVPGLKVQEPVALGNVPYLFRRVIDYIHEWLASRNDPEWNTGAMKAWRDRHGRL